jgi:peptidoglycan/xylan/chitin deacetylase (PgdA/CDA1 family)
MKKRLRISLIGFAVAAIFISNLVFAAGSAYAMPTPKTTEKVVALTFDDGPSKEYTPQFLTVFKKYNAKVTFFVCGGWVKVNPDILKMEYAAGHEIANHTYTHPLLSKMSEGAIIRELTRTSDIIDKTIHVYPIVMRPPFGASSPAVNSAVAKLGFHKVTWTFLVNDYDYKKTTSDRIASQIIANAHPGAILVMHDGNGNRQKTLDALPKIIETLRDRGYRFVTVAEILHVKPYR